MNFHASSSKFGARVFLIASSVFAIASTLLITAGVFGQSFHNATASAPAAGSMFVFPERIPLKAGGWFTATRGNAFVPLNRSAENSDVISIEFYKFPRAATANPNTPPLFMLRGGPGFEGLEPMLKRAGTFEDRLQGWLNLTDVVVVGQRGIGSSKPDTVIEQPRTPALGNQFDPKAIEQYQSKLALERDYWIGQGVDLSGFNVVEAAADVRDIAKGLGYQKITIMGGSFGSHWGMTLIRNHPDVVARAILHGMEGPDHTWDHPGWIWNVYKRVAGDAEKSEALAELIPQGGLVNAVERMILKAKDDPESVKVNSRPNGTIVIDEAAMHQLARGYTNRLPHWPAEIITMDSGDYKQAARRLMPMLVMNGLTGRSTASYWMLDSSSGITQSRRDEFESDPAMKIVGSTFGQYAIGSPVWDADLGDGFRGSFQSEIPTIIVHGTWDTSTPYENAVELAPWFTNGTLVTVHRGSHGAIYEAMEHDPSFTTSIERFIVDGSKANLKQSITLPQPKWAIPRLERE